MKKVNVVRKLPLGGADLQQISIEGGVTDNVSQFVYVLGNIVAIKPEAIVMSTFHTLVMGTLTQRLSCWAITHIGWQNVAYFWLALGAIFGVMFGQLWALSQKHRSAILCRLMLVSLGVCMGVLIK